MSEKAMDFMNDTIITFETVINSRKYEFEMEKQMDRVILKNLKSVYQCLRAEANVQACNKGK
jgi:hypothetical protein